MLSNSYALIGKCFAAVTTSIVVFLQNDSLFEIDTELVLVSDQHVEIVLCSDIFSVMQLQSRIAKCYCTELR